MYESFYQLTDTSIFGRAVGRALLPGRFDRAGPREWRLFGASMRGTGEPVVMGAAGTGKSMLCHVLAA